MSRPLSFVLSFSTTDCEAEPCLCCSCALRTVLKLSAGTEKNNQNEAMGTNG